MASVIICGISGLVQNLPEVVEEPVGLSRFNISIGFAVFSLNKKVEEFRTVDQICQDTD